MKKFNLIPVFFAVIMAVFFFASCEKEVMTDVVTETNNSENLQPSNVPSSSSKEITLTNGYKYVTFRLVDKGQSYDQNHFKLVTVDKNEQISTETHTDDLEGYENAQYEHSINAITNQLPTIEIVKTNYDETEDYLIELDNNKVKLPDMKSNSRDCSWYNGSCVIHNGCWVSRYLCSCGGAHYSSCNFGNLFHWHSY
ncbi:MAG: hypothetical protein JNM36_00130 [Chitinophagales bacterium]|nr:hypothetical protein [Chitinophagales bacterium]